MLTCVCAVRITWVLLIVNRFHTIGMLCLAYPISWILCATVFFLFYLKGDWLHSRIRALGMQPEVR